MQDNLAMCANPLGVDASEAGHKNSHLLSLPVEILTAILAYLDVPDMLLCKAVCKPLLTVIRESLGLQYKIELFADGMDDGPPGPLSISDRYKLLLARRRRWREFDWSATAKVPAPANCQAYELVGGVLATSRRSDNPEPTGSRHLSLTTLPTASTPESMIDRDDIGFFMRDFAIDPSQDLVACVHEDDWESTITDPNTYLNVSLRTMSTNARHPKAAVAKLSIQVAFIIDSLFIQIVDDVIGAFFWADGMGLVIWNWETGEVLVNLHGTELPVGTFDFAFLSSRVYMLTSVVGDGVIYIYTYDGTPAPGSPSGRAAPTRVASLRLPDTKPGRVLQRFYTHCGPFVRYMAPGKPFAPSRESYLHVMTLDYGPGALYHLCVLNRFLLSLISRGVLVSDSMTLAPWEDWGVHNAYMHPSSHAFEWLRYVHGSRIVLRPLRPVPEPDPPGLFMLIALDFNVNPARTDDPVPMPTSMTMGSESYSVVTLHEVVPEGNSPFQEAVRSSLPYAVSKRIVEDMPLYTGFLVDDERIVGMRSGGGHSVDLDVYMF